MFFRLKSSGNRQYVQIVENRREDGQVRQHVVATVGRHDQLASSGALASLLQSGARLCDQVMVLSAMDEGAAKREMKALRIGGPLLFGRLWERLGIGEVLRDQLADRGFEFAVERAVFVSVLHRLFVSGSDRSCEKWMTDYKIDGIEGLQLHHLYRAVAWLGEEIEDKAEGGLAPRCVKDVIEETLFDRRRDLFTDLSLVFMDTTTLSFYGEGGETLGAHGHSKDYRPDLKQVVLAVVIDGTGRPICSEMMPGNTADSTVLLPIVDRLQKRFGIGRVCVVADRGMISQATIAALEARKLEYILGARERSSKIVRDTVMDDTKPFVPLLIERTQGETQLFVKEVVAEGERYIVCRNEAEAEKDRADRQAIVEGLQTQLKRGDKALVGNKGYRRYLKLNERKDDKPAFEIDAGKLAEEARYDGIFVLRTNAKISPLMAVLRYRDLLKVEELFRRAKAVMKTRPIYHSSDEAIRGHIFCSFLALLLQKELADLCAVKGVKLEWQDLLRDLDRLQEAEIRHNEKQWNVRTEAGDTLKTVLKAASIALPSRAQSRDTSPDAKPVHQPRRRGRPRRSATTL